MFHQAVKIFRPQLWFGQPVNAILQFRTIPRPAKHTCARMHQLAQAAFFCKSQGLALSHARESIAGHACTSQKASYSYATTLQNTRNWGGGSAARFLEVPLLGGTDTG
eukprot:3112241-Amphidinium_carterae.1